MIKSLSIIFPVFNEELRLKSSFNHIASFLKKKKKFKTEIIFADDGSKDNSYNLITQFIKNFKANNKTKIKVIKLKRNFGKGAALKLGVKNAKHEWILTADIDMSVSLFQISNWIKKKLIDRKYFVYFGSRAHEKSIVKKKKLRDILGDIMRFFVYTILNIKIKDTQCGYKLYKKKIAKLTFSKLKNSGFDHDLEIILFLKSKRIKIMELPVKWIHKNNSSLNIFWDPIKMLVGIFLLKFRNF
jgi:dolichyl-phosphate beta-glucosyltransferase